MNEYLISNYRDTKKDQFVLKIVDLVEYMGEKAYLCIHDYSLSPYQGKFQDDEVRIRLSLIGGNDNLYSYFTPPEKKERFEQLKLF